MNLKTALLQLYFIFFSTALLAQYQVTLDVTVLNKQTNKPVPYVNVHFTTATLKTVGTKKGKITLTYDEDMVGKKDILQFTALGYQPLQLKASRLFRIFKNTDKIYLIPEGYQQDKVITSIQTIQQKGNIYGRVFLDTVPLQGATVQVKNTFTETQTDNDGRYRIAAQKGTVLKVTFLGMKPKEVLVGATNKIDIKLKPIGEQLKKVVVTGRTKKDKKVDLGFGGKKSFNAVGYDVKILTAKDIGPEYYDLSDLLVGKFANVSVSRDRFGNTLISVNREGSIYNKGGAIIDLDGQIFMNNSIEEGSNPQFPIIDPQQIASIAILKSLASTNKYGSRGKGGVIVIRTKTFVGVKAAPPKKTALIKGNDYTEELPLIATVEQKPTYIKDLEKAVSYKEALTLYKQIKEQATQVGIPFYLNTSDYFKRWDSAFSEKILSDITQAAYNNATALKTLAFKYETLKQYNKAKQIYQRIAILRPKDAQSYRDLALIYKESGNYTASINLYKQMLRNAIQDVDFSGIREVLENELKQFLALHRNKVKTLNDFSPDFLKVGFKYDIRIVFEWNDPYAEFAIQFVNPHKKYFNWSHSRFENKKRLYAEITKGYHTEEYIIDASDKGDWLINIKYLNDTTTLNPTYLKYTVYKHYGLPNQTKTIRLIKLYQQQTKVTLDKINYGE